MLETFLQWFGEFEAGVSAAVAGWIVLYGGLGVLVGMFLESSIVPIPSEAVLVTAGLFGIPPLTVAIWGGIGSTLGAIVGYYLGKKGGRPIVDKLGPYLFITNERVLAAEKECRKYGGKAVLVARLIPFVPFKVFSITAGILKLDFKQFVAFTLIGSVPRCFVLAWIGSELVGFKAEVLLLLAALVLAALVVYFFKKKNSKSASSHHKV